MFASVLELPQNLITVEDVGCRLLKQIDCVCWQVEVPEWYVPGAVRATSPETPRVTAGVQASHAASQEVAAAFDITHGEES